MFDEKTIIARLQNGEDASTIANEMTKAINSAMKAYEDQKKAEAEAEKAKQNEVQKKKDLDEALNALKAWFCKYYGATEESLAEINADEVLPLFDSIQEYIEALKGIVFDFKPAVKAPEKRRKANSADDAINEFLKNMGW